MDVVLYVRSREREREEKHRLFSREHREEGRRVSFVRSSSRRDSGSLASGERIPSSESPLTGGREEERVYRAEIPKY